MAQLTQKLSAEGKGYMYSLYQDEVKQMARPHKLAIGAPFPRPDRLGLSADGGTTRFTLVDFSALGCHPCDDLVAELVVQRKLYPDTRLGIVTFMIGAGEAQVRDYVSLHSQISWKYLPIGYDDPLITACDVWFYPKLALVDPTGTVVALDDELRGDRLPRTLEKFLTPSH